MLKKNFVVQQEKFFLPSFLHCTTHKVTCDQKSYIHTHWVTYKQTSLHTFIHAHIVGHARTPVFWVCMVNMLKNQILAEMSVYINDKAAVAPLEKSCSFHGQTY